jgi:hypothetical protein
MKVNIKETQKIFKPQTIEVIIENEADLAWAWGISNCSITQAEGNLAGNQRLQSKVTVQNHSQPQLAFFNAIDKLKRDNGF